MGENIARLRERFDLVGFLEGIDLGAYIVDRERRILYWNRRAAEMTGYAGEEVVGRFCRDNILNHQDRMGNEICKTELCPLYRTIRTKKSISMPFSINALTKWKTRIPFNVYTFPLFDGEELVGGVEIFDQARPRDRDMINAMNIQKALIPKILPMGIEVFYHPCDFLGGDLVYVNGTWAVVLDVTGHGVSSALISTTLRVILSEILIPELPIGMVGNLIEERYGMLGDLNVFFTGIFLKRVQGGVEILSCGHPAPMKISHDAIETVPVQYDILLGWGKKHPDTHVFVKLAPDESILLFSDGLTDIRTEGGPLGEEGLKQILRESGNLQDIFARAIDRSVDQFHMDDITMVRVSG